MRIFCVLFVFLFLSGCSVSPDGTAHSNTSSFAQNSQASRSMPLTDAELELELSEKIKGYDMVMFFVEFGEDNPIDTVYATKYSIYHYAMRQDLFDEQRREYVVSVDEMKQAIDQFFTLDRDVESDLRKSALYNAEKDSLIFIPNTPATDFG